MNKVCVLTPIDGGEDGFGMTNDKEINLYGVIDRKGKVVKKFTLEK